MEVRRVSWIIKRGEAGEGSLKGESRTLSLATVEEGQSPPGLKEQGEGGGPETQKGSFCTERDACFCI